MFAIIRSTTLALATAALAVVAMPDLAYAQMADKAIEARKALMKNNGKNMKVVVGFVKKNEGTASDVARSARTVASNMAQFANYFPKGTAQGGGAGNTRAKAAIWDSWPKFVGSTARATQLALDLSAAAESGDKGAIGKALGALGKGCGGCHKAWRGPKN